MKSVTIYITFQEKYYLALSLASTQYITLTMPFTFRISDVMFVDVLKT